MTADTRATLSRCTLAGLMAVAGVAHLARPASFLPAMPPGWFTGHERAVIVLTGVLELAAAVGLLTKRLRRPAAWGLVAFFVAVWPANVHIAARHVPMFGLQNDVVAWVRVALQPALIFWAYSVARRPR